MKPPLISKSRYLSGLQCDKLLWHHFNAKNLFPPVDAATQAIFDQGHEVGRLAQSLYPGGFEVAQGILAPAVVDKLSRAELARRRPLFEAGFMFGKAFARADVLAPAGESEWDIVEVKSSTEVKDVNIDDLSLQLFAYEGAGLAIRRCFVMHIDNEYVRRGAVDPSKFFKRVDVTKEVRKLLPGVPKKLDEMEEVIAGKCPEILIGLQCADPYPCALQELCWKFLPPNNVLTLNHLKKETGFSLVHQGILDIRDIPVDIRLSENQKIQAAALKSGKVHIDRAAIRAFLATLRYPVAYLDFETFQAAIPLLEGTRPYQQVPFQYSLERQEEPAGATEHFEFLANGPSDPREKILEGMMELLGTAGSIVAYNAPFEKRILRELADLVRGSGKWYGEIETRFVDLYEPFRSFAYYHSAQGGSASIKAVLPALVGETYEGMAIAEGGEASREFLRIAFGEGIDERERAKVKKNLLAYCRQDTEGMVKLVGALENIAR